MNEIYILGGLALVIIVLAIASLIAFYKRATKEESYVRTGLGGEKVIINAGSLVFPIVHHLERINMRTIEIPISRKQENSLITADKFRVDIAANFFVRINEEKEDVALAAQTLGDITAEKDKMIDMFEERCEAALNAVVSKMDMHDLHTNKQHFREEVADFILDDLKANGLVLQSVALKHIDQTELRYFNEENAFDSEGLTLLTQRISTNEVKRADAEARKEIDIREKQYNAEKDRIEYDQKLVEQEEEKRKMINDVKQQTEKDIEFARITKERDIELFKQSKDRLIAEGQRKVAQVWISTDRVKAEAAKAAEQVATARETAQAERNKAVEMVNTTKEADRQRILAKADSDSKEMEAHTAAIRYQVEADGKQSLNEAMNLLSDEQITMQIKMEIVKQLPEIVRESVRPLENIDGIKILQVDGLNGGTSSSGGGNGNSNGGGDGGSLSDQIVNSALRYKAQAPLVDSLLKEVGLKGSDINQMTKALSEEISDLSDDDDRSEPFKESA